MIENKQYENYDSQVRERNQHFTFPYWTENHMSTHLSTLPVDEELKMALPIDDIESRLSTSIIFSHYDRRKGVIKLGLILSKKARAFIIT